jgi:transposase
MEAVEKRGHSIRQTAKLFGVGYATVELYPKRYREQGNLTPGTPTGRPRLLSAEQGERLRRQLDEHADLTLQQRRELFEQETGVAMSYVTMHRLIRRFNVSRKKRC